MQKEHKMIALNGRPTRRSVLVRGGQAAIALAAARLNPLLAAPRSRWFKIGGCEWMLGKCAPSSLEVAKRIGLDGIQLGMGTGADGIDLRRPEVRQAYLKAAKATGLEISSASLSWTNAMPLKSDPRAAQWLADSIDAGKALGLPLIMPACFGRGDLDMANAKEIDHLVEMLKSAVPKAEKQGMLLGLESYLSAEDNLKILERVGSPALRVYYDVGNSTDKGRDVLKEIPLLGKLICEFHFKDANFRLGQGRLDFRKVRKALDRIEYSGWIHIEAAVTRGVAEDYAADYRYLRRIFPERG
jgi:sugar phosphate isomerase/epimerase